MRISCIIIEDDPQIADMTAAIIHKHLPAIDIKNHAADIGTARQQIITQQPDFVLLDVNLKDGNAFELLQSLPTVPFRIIFMTAYDKYAVQAFKYSALDFLLKPFTEQELVNAIEKVIQVVSQEKYQLQLETLYSNMQAAQKPHKLVLNNADAVYLLNFEDILFVQAKNNYSVFNSRTHPEITISKPLKWYEDELQRSGFIRVHQTYLVNGRHITGFNKKTDMAILTGGQQLPVSQNKRKMLLDFIGM